jgi:hypothetical protein
VSRKFARRLAGRSCRAASDSVVAQSTVVASASRGMHAMPRMTAGMAGTTLYQFVYLSNE